MGFRKTWSQLSWKLTVTSQAWMVTILHERQPPSLVFASKPQDLYGRDGWGSKPHVMDNKQKRDPVTRSRVKDQAGTS